MWGSRPYGTRLRDLNLVDLVLVDAETPGRESCLHLLVVERVPVPVDVGHAVHTWLLENGL